MALCPHTSELRDVACHMGSHNVTCHPTQVNVAQPERLVIDLPSRGMEGLLSLHGVRHKWHQAQRLIVGGSYSRFSI